MVDSILLNQYLCLHNLFKIVNISGVNLLSRGLCSNFDLWVPLLTTESIIKQVPLSRSQNFAGSAEPMKPNEAPAKLNINMTFKSMNIKLDQQVLILKSGIIFIP